MLGEQSKRCDAAFKRTVLLACVDALERAGFARFRKEEVDWPLHDGFHCWVGLNSAIEPSYIEINPFVGLHVVPLMKLYMTLEKQPYSRLIATYAVHMGKLSPNTPVFRFARSTDVDAEAKRLAALYVQVGLPFAQSIASYEKLLPLLKERVDMLGAFPERFASCLYLMGRKEEARIFAMDFLEKKPDYFRGFAVPFLKLLSN